MQVAEQPTDRGMVVPSPLGWEPVPGRPRQAWRWILAGVLLLVAVAVALTEVTAPYYELFPGDAMPVNGAQGVVTVKGAHVGDGDILLATVLEEDHVTLWEQLTAGWLHPDATLLKRQDVTGGMTQAQYTQYNTDLMAASQQYAKVAALRRLGYSVPELGDGAVIESVESGAPASPSLRAGDVITGVDGTSVNLSTDLTRALQAVAGGAVVRLQVTRAGVSQSVTIRTVPCGSATCPDAPTRAFLGIMVATRNDRFSFPPDVHLDINVAGIGGPSAGLAFTLGAIEALTGHDITGGARVAATGAIEPTGVVDQVGGVKQKTIAVSREHAQYFFVPRAEAADARKAAAGRHLTIVPVDTLDQALAFLRSIHGDLRGIPATATG